MASTEVASKGRVAEPTGIGLGLRGAFADELFEQNPNEVRWVEIHPENYVRRGGRYQALVERASTLWPIVTHGLTLGFGTTERYDPVFVREVRALLDRYNVPWHSDHLCWPGVDGVMLHDLMPLPFTRDAVKNAVQRVREMRDALERPVAIENVSYYVGPGVAEMTEWDFLVEVAERADAKILLDVNNIYVNARNHGFDARTYIDKIPVERVVQMHIAGHLMTSEGFIVDTHAEPICDDVYSLFEYTLARTGPVPVLLERDDKFPTLDELLGEVRRLTAIYDRATLSRNAPVGALGQAR